MGRVRDGRLIEIMAALAARDGRALEPLWAEYGHRIGAFMDGLARGRGYGYVPRHAVGDLVSDACLVMWDLAPAWRPDGGALPWVWARHRLAAGVDRVLGPPTLPFPDGEQWAPPPPPIAYQGTEPPARVTLVGLAGGNGSCRLLLEALDRALPRVDQELLLRHAIARRAGDPSPAQTLGPAFGLQPDAVRTRVSRARRRLQRVIDADAALAGALADLPLLTPGRPNRAA
jgi:DNA-directed RNA polymerase specialized sigma24 family protein